MVAEGVDACGEISGVNTSVSVPLGGTEATFTLSCPTSRPVFTKNKRLESSPSARPVVPITGTGRDTIKSAADKKLQITATILQYP